MDADGRAGGDLKGLPVVGAEGHQVGEVVDTFTDHLTGQPEWVLVRAVGDDDDRNYRFLPLVDADVSEGVVRVGYDRDLVFSAPDVGGGGHLNVDDEAQLYVHYGLDPWEHGAKSGGRTGGTPTGVPLTPHTSAGPEATPLGDDGATV